MKTSSAKQKGRQHQQAVRARILHHFPQLSEDDVVSTSMGAPGIDVKLSPRAQEVLPLAIECKATETFNMRQAWEQAKANAKNLNPVVVHRKNRTEPVVICDLEYFLELHADNDKLAKKVLELKEYKAECAKYHKGK